MTFSLEAQTGILVHTLRPKIFCQDAQRLACWPEERINGYKFGGNGYVILTKNRFNPSKASLVKFSFRTFVSEGLTFLMGTPGKDFLSLEFKDGKVIYQYELGSGRATIASTQRYNDGKWHLVTANRMNQDGILKVDTNTGEPLVKHNRH